MRCVVHDVLYAFFLHVCIFFALMLPWIYVLKTRGRARAIGVSPFFFRPPACVVCVCGTCGVTTWRRFCLFVVLRCVSNEEGTNMRALNKRVAQQVHKSRDQVGLIGFFM